MVSGQLICKQERNLFCKPVSSPSWAPDSEQLCYTLSGNIMIKNTTKGTTEQLTQDRRYLRPNWHPSKNKIAFDDAFRNIYAIDITTKEIVDSVINQDIGVAAQWLGDTDSVIVLMENAYKIVNIRTGNVLSDIKANLLTGVHTITYPAVLPDGTKIAFQAGNGIYIINTDGSGLQQILHNRTSRKPGKPFQPGDKLVGDMCWHPDGKHILYQQVEFISSNIAPWGFLMGEGYSTIYKLNIEQALQINKP